MDHKAPSPSMGFPPKKKMSLGVKLAIGCGGCFVLLVLATVIGGFAIHAISSSPSSHGAQAQAASDSGTQTEPLISENEKAAIKILARIDFQEWAKGGKITFVNQADVPEIIRVSSGRLQRDYSANEVNADLTYKDKNILISGTVLSIDRSLGSNYFLSLSGGENMFMSPHVQMADGFVNYLASLKKGQQVTLYGKCDGMLMGSATLSECRPVESWSSAIAEDYTDKYINKLPELIKNKYIDGLRLGATATAMVVVLATPARLGASDGDEGKIKIAIYESFLASKILERSARMSTEELKKYKTDNRQEYVNARIKEVIKRLNSSDSKLIQIGDFSQNWIIKDKNGNEITTVEAACEKYGLNPSEVQTLWIGDKSN